MASLPTPTIPLSSILNLNDFERSAELTLKPKTWAYYASAADSSETKHRNESIWREVRFRPRVLRNVGKVDTSVKVLGFDSKLPFMISPAAMGRLAHKDGEKCLVRGAGSGGIIYGISTHASVSHQELMEHALPGQTLFYQLYMNRDASISESDLRRIVKLGYKAVILTVDTPVPGNRELDLRTGLDAEAIALQGSGTTGKRVLAVAATASTISCSIKWDIIAWIKQVTGLPVIVKGIQTVEDALLVVEHGAKGIALSNHGGRQVSTAPTPLEILLEIREYAPHLLAPDSGVDIILDGGVRRGTDVVIALCLGAKAVSLGRPFMYSLPYGTEGVEHLIAVLGKEVATAMALLGATSVSELRPEMVNTVAVRRLLAKL